MVVAEEGTRIRNAQIVSGSFRRGNSRSEIHLIPPTTIVFQPHGPIRYVGVYRFVVTPGRRRNSVLAFVCVHKTSVGCCNRSQSLAGAAPSSLFIYINIHRVAGENSCKSLCDTLTKRAGPTKHSNREPRVSTSDERKRIFSLFLG